MCTFCVSLCGIAEMATHHRICGTMGIVTYYLHLLVHYWTNIGINSEPCMNVLGVIVFCLTRDDVYIIRNVGVLSQLPRQHIPAGCVLVSSCYCHCAKLYLL